METTIYILHYFSSNIILSILLAIALSVAFILMKQLKKKKGYLILSVTVPLIFGLFFPLAGTSITKPLINKYGKNGTGVITSIEHTNNRFNKERVMEYRVLLKKENGKTIETSFKSWTNNLYPGQFNMNFPTPGEEFNIKYLPNYPDAFIILTNDDSPYSKAGKCGELGKKLNDARIKYEFDTTSTENRNNYADIMEKYFIKNKCFPNDTFEDYHKEEVKRLRKNQ